MEDGWPSDDEQDQYNWPDEKELQHFETNHNKNLNYSKCRNFIFITIEDVQKLLPKKLEETMECLAMDQD